MKTKVGFIGCGNMGTAILAGIKGKCSVAICEKDKKRASLLKKKYKVVNMSLEKLAAKSQVIILAVKPQDFESTLNELKEYLIKNTLIISIAAGITTTYIEKKLGLGVKVIRTMPNLPAQVGQGMTGISRGRNATLVDIRKTKMMFESVGEVVVVNESKLDAITAVSGSGPAYVFYFIECLQAAARSLGLKNDEVDLLVMQTLTGSLDLLKSSNLNASEWRKRVTSKKGTTEAALKELESKKVKGIIQQALKAAAIRSKKLSR